MLIAGGTLAVLIYFVAAFFRVIMRSIRRLSDGASQISTGDLGTHRPACGTIERRSDAINGMVKQFSELILGSRTPAKR